MLYSKYFLSKKYDELYQKATDIIKKFNPCQIKGNTCFASRTNDFYKDGYLQADLSIFPLHN